MSLWMLSFIKCETSLNHRHVLIMLCLCLMCIKLNNFTCFPDWNTTERWGLRCTRCHGWASSVLPGGERVSSMSVIDHTTTNVRVISCNWLLKVYRMSFQTHGRLLKHTFRLWIENSGLKVLIWTFWNEEFV